MILFEKLHDSFFFLFWLLGPPTGPQTLFLEEKSLLSGSGNHLGCQDLNPGLPHGSKGKAKHRILIQFDHVLAKCFQNTLKYSSIRSQLNLLYQTQINNFTSILDSS